MAFGIFMNTMEQKNNFYDRSKCSLDLSRNNTFGRLRHWDTLTSPTSPDEPITNGPSVLASPSMNMPVLCQYNPYSPASQIVQSMASPSNTYAHSPGGSSTYSVSPINSPQQSIAAEEYYRYGLRQAFQARHAQEYGYYYPHDYASGKRRKRDSELTSEEYEKRRLRRERNKQAALRCRTRRRERIDALEQETSQIEEDNQRVQSEVMALKKQIEELQGVLKEHKCSNHVSHSDQSKSKAFVVKTEK